MPFADAPLCETCIAPVSKPAPRMDNTGTNADAPAMMRGAGGSSGGGGGPRESTGTHAQALGDEAGDDSGQDLVQEGLQLDAGVGQQRSERRQQQAQVRQRAQVRRHLLGHQLDQVRRQRVQA